MPEKKEPFVIKKYANRRLYDTGTSSYVTLEDLAEMVKREEEFVVLDAKTREDITRSVLTQIIVEQENKGQYLLPIPFLRQLIRFYGDSMQGLVPNFLEHSISSLAKDQDKFRDQLTQALGTGAFDMIEDQVRRNTKIFEQTMKMFTPVAMQEENKETSQDSQEQDAETTNASEKPDLAKLQKQLNEMQSRIDKIAESEK